MTIRRRSAYFFASSALVVAATAWAGAPPAGSVSTADPGASAATANFGSSVATASTGSFVVSEMARRIEASIVGLDFETAERDLAIARSVTDDPRIAVEQARLALYQLDCDGAAALLGRPEVHHAWDGEALYDIARGCQRVTASLLESTDEARGIEVRWQDENDSPLAPLLFDTIATAREALTRDLGVDWPLPTRVVVVRDLLSLSAMTGLPYDSARTTGTVAVAKWGRVTLLSPRASRHGYPWRDTLAHELTHLAVSHATDDLAPLWLQEGVAKRQETRWRAPGPFDERPPPDAVARQGIGRGTAIRLDQLGPSIAMLPTADAAMMAFAEVTSFVNFYSTSAGPRSLPDLFRGLAAGKSANDALVAASGADLAAWDGRWRAYLTSRPPEPVSPLLSPGASAKPATLGAFRELRDRSRLAELLLSRDHAQAALDELDRIPLDPAEQGDPSVVWLRGRALEMANRAQDAAPLVSSPARVVSSYGPWWALRGRWAQWKGDEPTAKDAFDEARSVDPLDSEAVCGGDSPSTPSLGLSLCDAAKSRGEPPFEDD